MKIACIATSQVPSSTANSIQLMKASHALAENGHEVRVWVPGSGTVEWKELADRYGLRKEFSLRWVKSMRALRRYDFTWISVAEAKAWGADLVYTWLPQVSTLAMKRGMGAVLELHDRPTGLLGPRFVLGFFKMRGRKRLLVITDALRKAVEKDLAVEIPPGEVLVAPNGVELERYAGLPDPTEARLKLGLTEKITAVYSGHFYRGRGVELLLGLSKRFPEVQFLWVGGMPESVADMKELLHREGITNTEITGFVDNRHLPVYQAAGEILLMPYERRIAGSSGGNSADICSPMKMFEYLASGRAILSSDLPVLHEVLNENNSLFCEPENLESWCAGLKKLVEGSSLRNRLGRQAALDAAGYAWTERARRALDGF